MENVRKWNPAKKAGAILLGIVIFIGISLLFGFFVMLLWNWLMPDIFNLPVIGYWQAWGLVVLAHLLFKGGHRHRWAYGHHGTERWKEKFRHHFREHMAHQYGREFDDREEDSRPYW